MKFSEEELSKIRDFVLDSMTIEKCAELTSSIVDDMKSNPELNALDSVEKIYWTVRMAYVIGYMKATVIFNEALEGDRISTGTARQEEAVPE